MVPKQVLLALCGLAVANGISIQIDVGDGSASVRQEQLPFVAGVDDVNNASIDTTVATNNRTLSALSCPGKCAVGDFACPAAHKTVRIAKKGSPFYVYCGMEVNADNNRTAYSNIDTNEACINLCEQTNWCIAAQWASSKTCYMERTIRSAYASSSVNSFVKMSMKFPEKTSCPADDGKIITSYSGRPYKIWCDYDQATSIKRFPDTYSYEECVNHCDDTPGCASASMQGTLCWAYGLYTQPPKGDKISPLKGSIVFEQIGAVPSEKQECCPATA